MLIPLFRRVSPLFMHKNEGARCPCHEIIVATIQLHFIHIYPYLTSYAIIVSFQVKEKEKEVRILILGLDNAGKTTILRKFCGEPTDTIEPTLGFNIKTLEHKTYQLNVWDVGGQKTIRAYWRNYFERTDGLLWVVDSTDKARLDICRKELRDLLEQEKLAGASLLIFANKQDVRGAITADEIATSLGLREGSSFQSRHWSIRGCSAMTGEGLVEGIDWIVEDIASRIFTLG